MNKLFSACDTIGTFIGAGSSAVVSGLAVFSEKKIVKEKPKTLDQLVNSALSRLKVSLQAEVDWTVRDMKKSWKEQ